MWSLSWQTIVKKYKRYPHVKVPYNLDVNKGAHRFPCCIIFQHVQKDPSEPQIGCHCVLGTFTELEDSAQGFG